MPDSTVSGLGRRLVAKYCVALPGASRALKRVGEAMCEAQRKTLPLYGADNDPSVVSTGGKTRTAAWKGKNSLDRDVHSVLVFDKQRHLLFDGMCITREEAPFLSRQCSIGNATSA